MALLEKRKQQRLSVSGSVAAALDDERCGVITDIHTDGLAFRYVASQEESEQQMKRKGLVSITTRDFTVADLPCRIVSDRYLLAEYSAMGRLRMFKCCLQFQGLDAGQKKHLQDFLKHHTTDPADTNPGP
jgi:hypothetical protein